MRRAKETILLIVAQLSFFIGELGLSAESLEEIYASRIVTASAARESAISDDSVPSVYLPMIGGQTQNLVEITTDDESIKIQPFSVWLQQDTLGEGRGPNELNATVSGGSGNTLYLSQYGDSLFTLNVEGSGNQVMLRELGGGTNSASAAVTITGSYNDIDIYSDSFDFNAVADIVDITVSSSNNVVVLRYDDFSRIVGYVNNGSSAINVVQNNRLVTNSEKASLTSLNSISFSIDNAGRSGGIFDLNQFGLNNELILNSTGGNNVVSVTQTNTEAAPNKLNLTINQGDTVLDIERSGPGEDNLYVGGTNNTLIINSDGDFGLADGVGIVSNVDQNGNGNLANLSFFKNVTAYFNGNSNTLIGIGNISNASVSGDENSLRLTNNYNVNIDSQIQAEVEGSDNTLDVTHSTGLQNISDSPTIIVKGSGNDITTDMTDVGSTRVNLGSEGNDGNYNNVLVTSSGLSFFHLDIVGERNTLDLDFSSNGGEFEAQVTGNDNNHTFRKTSSSSAEDSLMVVLVDGSSNTFEYGLSEVGFEHKINGDSFSGSVSFNELTGSYDQYVTHVGAGTMQLTAPAGTITIRNN